MEEDESGGGGEDDDAGMGDQPAEVRPGPSRKSKPKETLELETQIDDSIFSVGFERGGGGDGGM